jgi:mRNA-degrading endonuclease RelE of RelBE toxin-antitoxin system
MEERELDFEIRYTPLAIDHLRELAAHEQGIVLDSVEDQLGSLANIPTRNRKPLRPNPLATWELRLGDLRVFYTIETAAPERELEEVERLLGTVVVVAVGVKRGNRLYIGGQE